MAIIASLLLQGCDFFRKIAGRPTSDEIAAKRARIELEEARHQARLDSLKLLQQQASDSLALLDSIRRSGVMILPSDKLLGQSAAELGCRYLVMVGAFSDAANAGKQAAKAEAEGYKPLIVKYRNGFTAVGLCPSQSLSDAFTAYKTILQKAFCPKDAWILENE